MKNLSVKKLVLTALMLALLIAVQQFRILNQFITGPLVNAILIVTAVWVGLIPGLIVAIISPVFALFIPPVAPIMQVLPHLVPVIALGNATLVVLAYIFRKKNMVLGLAIASALKAFLLWVGVVHFVIPVFGHIVPEAMQPALTYVLPAMFSYNQLITAIMGSYIVLLIRARLDKALKPN